MTIVSKGGNKGVEHLPLLIYTWAIEEKSCELWNQRLPVHRTRDFLYQGYKVLKKKRGEELKEESI